MKKIFTIVLLLLPLLGIGQIYSYIGFEQPDTLVSADSSGLWQIATPGKDLAHSFFVDTHEGDLAIMTDSSQYYGASLYSSFYIDFFINGGGSVSFWHKINTESQKDGGFMKLEYRDSWSISVPIPDSLFINLADTFIDYPDMGGYAIQVFNSYKMSDTLYNGTPGFSGDKSQWEMVTINFICNAVRRESGRSFFPNNYRLHFYFISDSISDAKEGWIIDDIRIENGNFMCTSTEQIEFDKALNIFPNPVLSFLELKIEDLQAINGIVEIYSPSGQKISVHTIENNFTQIDVNYLSAGFYTIRWISEDGRIAFGKFIKI